MLLRFRSVWVAMALASVAGVAAGNERIEAFVYAPGFESVAVEPLWEAVHSALPAAPAASIQRSTANLGSASLGALALAVTEPALPRQRHQIRHGVILQESTAAGAAAPVSLVEVTRFNLGPAVRLQLVDSLGEEQVAPASEFGEGPHVMWRLATQPLRGNRAVPIAVSRRVLTDAEAAAMRCFGESCLSPYGLVHEVAPWPEPEDLPVGSEFKQLASLAGGPGAAAAVQHLQGEHEGEASESRLAGEADGQPQLLNEALVELGLGQDVGMEAVWRHGGLLDDSIAAQWQQMVAIPMADGAALVGGSTLWECRRGGDRFAPPGQYCP